MTTTEEEVQTRFTSLRFVLTLYYDVLLTEELRNATVILASIKRLISVLSVAKSSAPVTHHETSVLISDLQDGGKPRNDHEVRTGIDGKTHI